MWIIRAACYWLLIRKYPVFPAPESADGYCCCFLPGLAASLTVSDGKFVHSAVLSKKKPGFPGFFMIAPACWR
jgi:hypothetical protein